MSRRLGFDAKEEINLRTIAWVEAVQAASGMSLAALEREFRIRSKKESSSTSSCIWQKYKNGKVVPGRWTGLDGKLGLVERVEAKFKGTAERFDSPLWELCSDAPVPMETIKANYCALKDAELKSWFVADETERFWRKSIDDLSVCQRLIEYPGLPALVALMNLLRETETVQRVDVYAVALEAILNRLEIKETDASVLSKRVRQGLAEKIKAWQLVTRKYLGRAMKP